jgi:hypothetical protein
MPTQNITYTITKGANSASGTGSLSASYQQVGSGDIAIDTTLAAGSSNVAVAAGFGAPGNTSGALVAIELLATANMTIATNGTAAADVQTVSISGAPTGGTFALGFKGQITAPIAYNAAASAVQSALQALSTIGGGNVTCTGGPLPGTAVTCTFAGSMATGLQPLLTQNSGGLTGGTTPSVTVAHTTPGLPQDTIQLVAGVPLAWDAASLLTCPFAGAVTGFYVTSTNAGRFQGRILTY